MEPGPARATARIRTRTLLKLDTIALWLAYAGSAALVLWLADRFVSRIPAAAAVALALLPLALTGRAVLRGELYGPSDLYSTADPWRSLAASRGGAPAAAPRNAILSDLAFANLPWRAAVREAVVNGRAPLWNRFVLCGTPLLGAAQAGILHPATWLGIWLPLPLSWTFSCAFTLLLGFVSAFLLFSDFGIGVRAALVGSAAWGFSTYLVFWNGWSVGPSTATLPLLLLGLRRLARDAHRRAVAITSAALWLSLCGGHPESFFHGAAAGAVWFAWELFPRRGKAVARSLAAAAGAGALALSLSAPQLLPLLEAIPRSAEYHARRAAISSTSSSGRKGQSVAAGEAVRRLLPDLLPFAHGIFGKSPVDVSGGDGSGMPIGYAGAVLLPLAALALAAPRGRLPRGRGIFAALAAAGLAYGASAPGLMHLTERLPGFALALNYRLVFLAPLGLAGLAALGASELLRGDARRRLAVASMATAAALLAAAALARPVFAARGLPAAFISEQLVFLVAPVVLLAAVSSVRAIPVGLAALVLLVGQRFLEMRGTYPTLPSGSLAPQLPTLAALPAGADPGRVVAAGDVLRPNGSALYGLEDARGYESLVLDRFAETYPLWCRAQAASFNRVDDLTPRFLSAMNVRWAIASPGDAAPPGWAEQARGPEMAIFENPGALPRAFVPARLRRVADADRRLAEMAGASDFAATAWLSSSEGAAEEENGPAALTLRASGTDLVIRSQAPRRTLVATSIPDWPGWTARDAGGATLALETVNHAFVGVWIPAGRDEVRLSYRPRSVRDGLALFAAGAAACVAMAASRRRRHVRRG